MVVHLWGKYWMAAWRGGRGRVWVTGAITFLVAVPAALTGYVSQQNFDAQWISTQAKDAMNSVGVGAFFNLTNFGQMYSYHVLLLPIAVVAARAACTSCSCAATASCRRSSSTGSWRLQRVRAAPMPGAGSAGDRGRGAAVSLLRPRTTPEPWKGRYAPYDLVKELCIAVGVIALLAVLLTVLSLLAR